MTSPWRKHFSYPVDCAYFDHASTSQTPSLVINVMNEYYQNYKANVGRGVYQFAEQSTRAYEDSRQVIADFINAKSQEVVLTYGATDSLNMVANALVANIAEPKQIILISPLEHHSNIVPWQILAKSYDLSIQAIPLDNELDICWKSLELLLSKSNVAVIAVTHMSNVTGQSIDIKRLCQIANQVPVVVDGTQAISHLSVDVHDLGCAAYVFSAHKMYGPTGVGALYIQDQFWPFVKPFRAGGGMIDEVSIAFSTFKKGPQMLEAGTPAIASVIGFSAAATLLQEWGQERIAQHEVSLCQSLKSELASLPVTLYTGKNSSTVSFTYHGVHAHDVSTILASHQVMTRSGHHCCMPLMQHLNVDALTRVSIGCYNTLDDVQNLVKALGDVERLRNE